MQALRRHTAYQEITDAQIREAVLTMLTISVLSDTHSKAENISESSSGTENTTDMGDNSSILFYQLHNLHLQREIERGVW